MRLELAGILLPRVKIKKFRCRGDEAVLLSCSLGSCWLHPGSCWRNASYVWKQPSWEFQQWHAFLLDVYLGKELPITRLGPFVEGAEKGAGLLILWNRDIFPIMRLFFSFHKINKCKDMSLECCIKIRSFNKMLVSLRVERHFSPGETC